MCNPRPFLYRTVSIDPIAILMSGTVTIVRSTVKKMKKENKEARAPFPVFNRFRRRNDFAPGVKKSLTH